MYRTNLLCRECARERGWVAGEDGYVGLVEEGEPLMMNGGMSHLST